MAEHCKINLISANYSFTFNTDSWCELITVGVNIYLYWCASLLAPVCAVSLCLYDCTSKKPHHVLDLIELIPFCIKYTTKSGPCGTKVPRLCICRYLTSLSRITH